MKMKYHKPVVSFESFELSDSIAQSCPRVLANHAQGTCSDYGTQADPAHGCVFVDAGGYVIFLQNQCFDAPVDDQYGNLCYHVNTDSQRVFIS